MEFKLKDVEIIYHFSDITYNAIIVYDNKYYIISKIEKNKIYFADNEDGSHTGYVKKNTDNLFISIFPNVDEIQIKRGDVSVELLHYDGKIFKTGQVIKYTDYNDNDQEKKYTVSAISETDESAVGDKRFNLEGIIYDYSKSKNNQSTETVNFHLKVTDNGSTLKENEEDEYDIEDYSVKEADIPSSEGYRLKL